MWDTLMSVISLKKRRTVINHSIVDQKNWSYLWFCEMNELLQLKNDSVDVPPPLLYSALQVIKKMVVTDPLPPLQPRAENGLPQLPAPREKHVTMRRAKGYNRISPALLRKPEMAELLQGVEEVKEVCFQFSASIDGVDVFKNSATSNSCYFFSVFCQNLVRRLVPADLDAFFLLIVPCSASEEIAQEREEDANKDTFHDARTNSDRIPSSSRVGETLKFVEYTLRQAKLGKKMANMVFHSIMEAILPSIKEQGEVGFPLRIGRTLYISK